MNLEKIIRMRFLNGFLQSIQVPYTMIFDHDIDAL